MNTEGPAEKHYDDAYKRAATEDLVMINLNKVPGSSSFQADPVITKHHTLPTITIINDYCDTIEINAIAGSRSADSPT